MVSNAENLSIWWRHLVTLVSWRIAESSNLSGVRNKNKSSRISMMTSWYGNAFRNFGLWCGKLPLTSGIPPERVSNVPTATQFKSLCTKRTKSVFVESWHTELCDKPLLRSYRLYKNEFHTECYLDYINVPKYRISITKIRASSHDMEIERGR